MQKVSPLAKGIDKAMLAALLYIAAFVWMYTRVRSVLWAALLALPLTLLIIISGYMLITHIPLFKRDRLVAERKQHALFKLLTDNTDDALAVIASGVYGAYGLLTCGVENGVAYASDDGRTLGIGIVQGTADTRALLDFHKAAKRAQRALLCSLETPDTGTVALAGKLTKPSVTVYGPSEVMRYIQGQTPTDDERARDTRAKRAQSAWTALRRLAVRREQAGRYMLYALVLMAAYIVTGWVWYPIPAIVCAVLGAVSACGELRRASPFKDN